MTAGCSMTHDNGGEMTSSHVHGLRASWAWMRRLVRGFEPHYPASVEGVLVARSMGRYVPLGPTAAGGPRRVTLRATRGELLTEWTRSGALTNGEAELLMALDETTPWRV
jgi:hypothetical protein